MGERRHEMQQRLNGVFQDVFNDGNIEVFDAMTAKNIPEWDSLMHIVLVVAVEKEFGIKLNAAEVGKLENVGVMLTLLEERAKK